MTLFDIIAALILGVSLMMGLVRGAMYEVTRVAAFVLAVFVSVFALRLTGPVAAQAIHPRWAANIAAVIIVFLAAYVLVRVIGGALTRRVQQTKGLGALDRLVGGGFGLVRGLVALGVIGLVISAALPPPRTPAWIADAKLYPLSRSSGAALRALAPKGTAFAAGLKSRMGGALAEDGSPQATSAVGQSQDSGYSAAARRGLDDVVEKTR